MQSIRSRSNHVLPTSSNSNCTNGFPPSGKLMSISSIVATPPMYTSPSSTNMKTYYQEPMERRASAPSHPYNYPSYPSSMFRSPPTSPDDKLFETSAPSSPTLSVSSFSARKYRQDHDMDDDMMGHPPLTIEERRLRNKQASAKYRQKKNQQQNEMRVMIGRLSEQNAVLERQLQELRLENERLKSTADKLRGKMVAKKMLKKWIGRQQQPFNYALSSGSEHDDSMNAVLMANDHDEDDDDELESIDSQ